MTRPPLGTARVIRGDALNLPLEDESVDLVITSPPYFGLRSYQDGGTHYEGQIGAEPTPTEYVDALIAATREMARVVKPSGSIWVNLGDKYSGPPAGNKTPSGLQQTVAGLKDAVASQMASSGPRRQTGVRDKSLIGIPWRYAIRAIDDLGLILRAEIIWAKPNGLPESVTDRVRRSHETWFHFTREPRYFSAVDEIREAHAEHTLRYYAPGVRTEPRGGDQSARREAGIHQGAPGLNAVNPLGKLPGSVWDIPTQPLTVPDHLGIDHFAAFPMEFPRRIIQGWSPPGVCTGCGEGRRPVAERKPMVWRPGPKAGGYELDGTTRKVVSGTMLAPAATTITGYACACPDTTPPTTPSVILDPFGGTGTTALVAKALGRTGITVDMSADYCRLAEWRTNDPRELAAALQVDRPDPVAADQLDLLDGLLG